MSSPRSQAATIPSTTTTSNVEAGTTQKESSGYGFSWTIIPIAVGLIASITTLVLSIMMQQTMQIYLSVVVLAASLVGVYSSVRYGALTDLDKATDKVRDVTHELQQNANLEHASAGEALKAKEDLERALREQKTSYEETVRALEAEKTDLAAQVQVATEARQKLESQSQVLSRQLDSMKAAMGTIQERLAGINQQYSRYSAESKHLDDAVSKHAGELEHSAEDLEKEGDAFAKEIAGVIASMNNQVDQLTAKFEVIRRQIEEQVTSLHKADESIHVSAVKMDETSRLQQQNVEALKILIPQLRQERDAINEEKGKLAKDIESWSTQLQQLQKDHDALQTEIAAKQKELETIRGDIHRGQELLRQIAAATSKTRSRANSTDDLANVKNSAGGGNDGSTKK